jgi:hypothetical protein
MERKIENTKPNAVNMGDCLIWKEKLKTEN